MKKRLEYALLDLSPKIFSRFYRKLNLFHVSKDIKRLFRILIYEI